MIKARGSVAAIVAALVVVALVPAAPALAAGISKQRAAALANRAASARVERFGISYPRAHGRPHVTRGTAAAGPARSARAVTARGS